MIEQPRYQQQFLAPDQEPEAEDGAPQFYLHGSMADLEEGGQGKQGESKMQSQEQDAGPNAMSRSVQTRTMELKFMLPLISRPLLLVRNSQGMVRQKSAKATQNVKWFQKMIATPLPMIFRYFTNFGNTETGILTL